MTHSNIKHSKNTKGEDTSEGVYLKNVRKMQTTINWRGMKSMQHSPIERRLRKKMIALGANKNFENIFVPLPKIA